LEELSLPFAEENFDLIREAIKLASRLDIAIYDALYLCHASNTDASLITADRKLYNKTRELGNVELIGEA
jgi:predicted nucleic acid-binding protein